MSGMVGELITVTGLLWDFMEGRIIPTSIAEINIVHVAIWVPVTLGLISGAGASIKRMFGRRG